MQLKARTLETQMVGEEGGLRIIEGMENILSKHCFQKAERSNSDKAWIRTTFLPLKYLPA